MKKFYKSFIRSSDLQVSHIHGYYKTNMRGLAYLPRKIHECAGWGLVILSKLLYSIKRVVVLSKLRYELISPIFTIKCHCIQMKIL